MLEAFLPLISLSIVALVVSTIFALLKKLSRRSTKIVVCINSLFPSLLILIGILGRQISDCPHLLGECYNEEYSAWRYLILVPGSVIWIASNFILLAMIFYFLVKKGFSFGFILTKIRKTE